MYIRGLPSFNGAGESDLVLLDQFLAFVHGRGNFIPGASGEVLNVLSDFPAGFRREQKRYPAPTSPPMTKGTSMDRPVFSSSSFITITPFCSEIVHQGHHSGLTPAFKPARSAFTVPYMASLMKLYNLLTSR